MNVAEQNSGHKKWQILAIIIIAVLAVGWIAVKVSTQITPNDISQAKDTVKKIDALSSSIGATAVTSASLQKLRPAFDAQIDTLQHSSVLRDPSVKKAFATYQTKAVPAMHS